MRIFSKFVFICNACFVIAVVLRYAEQAVKRDGVFSGALRFQPLESTLVVLGYGAVIFNLTLQVMLLLKKVFGKEPVLMHWLYWFNLVLLFIEVIYFAW